MRTRRYLAALWTTLLVASLLIGACAPAAAPPSPTTAAPKQAAPTGAAGTAIAPSGAGAQAVPTAVPKPAAPLAKEQRIAIAWTEPPTLDPGKAEDNLSIEIITQIFEGLLEFDGRGTPIPLVAEKWSVSPDGLTYTFNIRQGPVWSDGTPVTARDFEYGWKRNLDPKTGSDYANVLYPIKGAEEFNTGKTTDSSTVGVSARDAQTLVVTLAEPAAFFLRLASTWTAFPLPKATIEKHGDKWTEAANILSNGPFRLKSWKHDAELVVEANDRYWKGTPTLQAATYKLFAQTDQTLAQQLAAYENDEVDVDRSLPPSDLDRIRQDPKLSKELLVYVLSGTYFIVPNSRKAPLDKPEVRRALALAIDPNVVIKGILKSASAQPATSIMPPGIPRDEQAYPKRPDLEAARKELAAAGFPSGQGLREILYTYNTNAVHKAIAEYLQQAWKQIGVNTKIDSMEWNVFLKWRREADYDLQRAGWASDYEDANNWYNVLLDSKSSDTQLSPHWKHEQFDRLVRQAVAEQDAKKREQLYMQADQILAREMPFIPIYYNGAQELVKPKVDGWNPARVLQLVQLKNVRIVDRQ